MKTGSGPIATGSASGPSIIAGASGPMASGRLLTPLGNGRFEITSAVNGLALTENTKSYFAEANPWTGDVNELVGVVFSGPSGLVVEDVADGGEVIRGSAGSMAGPLPTHPY